MAKQKCEKCGHDFSWVQIQKSLLRGYKPVQCSHCNEEHKIKDASKVIIAALLIFPVVFFVLLISVAMGLSGGQTFLYGAVYVFLMVLILPLIAKYGIPDKNLI